MSWENGKHIKVWFVCWKSTPWNLGGLQIHLSDLFRVVPQHYQDKWQMYFASHYLWLPGQLLLQKLLNRLNNHYFRNTTKDCDCSHRVFTNLLYCRLTSFHVYSPQLVLSCVLCQFATEMGAYLNIFVHICLFW